MPKISYIPKSSEEKKILGLITNRERLRATKPPIPKRVKINYGNWVYETKEGAMQGRAAYVWRMVAFMVSPKSNHHCMPVSARFDLPGTLQEVKIEMELLDKLVDRIVDSVDKSEWYGIVRWGRVLGVEVGKQVIKT